MTRTQAKEIISATLRNSQGEGIDVLTYKLLEVLDPCLRFEPEIAEMSAVCRGVGGLSHGG